MVCLLRGALEGVVQISILGTLQMPSKMHSKMLSPLKKQPKLVLCSMNKIVALQESIASVSVWMSESPPKKVLVAKSQFTVGFVPIGVWMAVQTGMFVVRNQTQHLWI